MAETMELSDRKDLYKQNKEEADDAFYANNYAEAAKLYLSCFNCINSLPRKMEVNEEENRNLADLIKICQRNFVISVTKGNLTAEEDRARLFINKLVNAEPTAKNLYLQGKLMLQMKYLTHAKEALKKSYELENNDKTLQLISSIKDSSNREKEMCKHIIENLEAERIKESQQKKREMKDDWFNVA
jgi:hypothetical protein